MNNPFLKGTDQALKQHVIQKIVNQHPMHDLFLLVVDRDCNRRHNSERANNREGEHDKLLACLALEELETWMLALHKKDLAASWEEVRSEWDPKETFAEPFLAEKGWQTLRGGGRKEAMRTLSGKWKTLTSLCPEIEDLRQRVARFLAD